MNLKNIPFTYHWILSRACGSDIKTVLDLGCGEGDLMEDIGRGNNWDITGVELNKDASHIAKERGIYKKVVRGDVTKLPRTVLNRKYDLVFSSQVLEHLKKEKGKMSLKTWGRLSKKKIVITTPNGFIEFDPIEGRKDENPLQKHLSGWKPEEFGELGFTVRGQGVRFIYGERGIARSYPQFLVLFSVIAYLFAPLVYYFPKFGTYMIAYKNI